MLDRFALPCNCATDQSYFRQWFGFLKELIIHPHLEEEEKYLGIWLASQCANIVSYSCSFSYDQISQMINKPPRFIHHALLSLKIMGFLSVDSLCISYSAPTEEMRIKIHVLTLIFPPRTFYKSKKELEAKKFPVLRVITPKVGLPRSLSRILDELNHAKKGGLMCASRE
jgi:hypothetical protein